MQKMGFLATIKSLAQNLSHHWILKSFLGFIIGAIIYAFSPQQMNAIMAVGGLVIADFVFKIISIGMKKSKYPFMSNRIKDTPVKLVSYLLLIGCSRMVECTMPIGTIVTDTVIGYLAVHEFSSILEHMGDLGYHIPIFLLKDLKKQQS